MALRRGAVGAHVRDWQNWLKVQGYDPGPIDGIFGPQTETAVEAFQGAAGLTANGIIGPETEEARRRGKVEISTHGTAESASKMKALSKSFRLYLKRLEDGRYLIYTTAWAVRAESVAATILRETGYTIYVPGVALAPGIPPPESTTPTITLRRGDTGAAVRDWQNWLKVQGFDPGPIDGIFGPQTETAVKAFQRAAGISADGIIGPITWSARSAWPATPGTTVGVDFRKLFFEALILARRGVKYLWGSKPSASTSPEDVSSCDCSGLVTYLFARAGFVFPHGSWYQYRASSPVTGRKIEIGDLAFQGTRSGSSVKTTHVVLALSENTAIEAVGGTLRRVITRNVADIGKRKTFLGWRRPNGLPLEAAVVVTPVIPPPTDTSIVSLFRHAVDSLKSLVRDLEKFGRGE